MSDRYVYDFSSVPGATPTDVQNNSGDGVLTYGTGTQQSIGYLAAIAASGLKRALIWEHNTDSILGGFDYGVSEAQTWNRDHPEGFVIYAACDLNDGALGGASVAPFLSGWATQLRPGDSLGVYGPDHAIAQAKTVPAVTHFWGVVNWLENSAPNNDPSNIAQWQTIGVDLIQLIGSPIPNTDQNLVLNPNWWATKPIPAPVKKEHPQMFIGVKRLNPTNGDCGAEWIDGGVAIRDFGIDNQQPWGPYALSLPQAAFDFMHRNPSVPVELLSPLEWAVIESRTKVTSTPDTT